MKIACHVQLEEDIRTHDEKMLRLEQLHTYTIFYLAQIYKNTEQFDKSALMCHETLVST